MLVNQRIKSYFIYIIQVLIVTRLWLSLLFIFFSSKMTQHTSIDDVLWSQSSHFKSFLDLLGRYRKREVSTVVFYVYNNNNKPSLFTECMYHY